VNYPVPSTISRMIQIDNVKLRAIVWANAKFVTHKIYVLCAPPNQDFSWKMEFVYHNVDKDIIRISLRRHVILVYLDVIHVMGLP